MIPPRKKYDPFALMIKVVFLAIQPRPALIANGFSIMGNESTNILPLVLGSIEISQFKTRLNLLRSIL